MPYPDFPLPARESDRLRALELFGVLDTPGDEHFDRLVRLTAKLIGVPIALITLVDNDRQWFLARHGLEFVQTPRHMSFCAHAIAGEATMVVHDAQLDQRFADNPLVSRDPHIRFYAGALLRTAEGHQLGTLCVIDSIPRILSDLQLELLELVAELVMRELELRRQNTLCSTTGLLKRSVFMDLAQKELEKAREGCRVVTLMLMDIDHFDIINQLLNHEAGDQILQDLARVWLGQLRTRDLLGRIVSDSFGLLFVDETLEGALDRAEVLRTETEELGASDSVGQCRISGGLTSLAPTDQSIDDLLVRAEAALHLAQANGGNQVSRSII